MMAILWISETSAECMVDRSIHMPTRRLWTKSRVMLAGLGEESSIFLDECVWLGLIPGVNLGRLWAAEA